MKTFSKVLSMFLVVVMCFGLFATSAYADSFSLDGSDDNAATEQYSMTTGDFCLDTPVVPESVVSEMQQATQYADGNANANSFALENANDAPAAKQEAQDEFTIDGFSLGDTDTFDAPLTSYTPLELYYDKSVADDPTNRTFTGIPADGFEGIVYTTTGTYTTSATALVRTSQYYYDSGDLLISADWLRNALPEGTYYFWGLVHNNAPLKLGFIDVSTVTPATFVIGNDPYVKDDGPDVWISEIYSGQYARFGVIPVTSTSGGSYLTVNDYYYDNDKGRLYIEGEFLNSLSDGIYNVIGFPNATSTTNYVTFGTITVKAGTLPVSSWTLTPDYQIWYSGTDPLTFYSDVFVAAGEGWNYKGYGWDVVVPDIRVSTRSSMAGATSVRIDQYWDLGYGYFMLGQNFLSSLSADETYYMQVIDARHPEDIYTNIVTFRVGPTLRAIDTDKHVINSTRSLRFRCSSPVAEVYVGNIMLTDPADFGVSWDGKTVTLSFEFLNKRSAGNTYTIKVRTVDGEWAATTFQVLTTAQGSASPRTGDESNLGRWAAFLLLSGTAVVVLVPKLKKQDF